MQFRYCTISNSIHPPIVLLNPHTSAYTFQTAKNTEQKIKKIIKKKKKISGFTWEG